MKDSVLQTNLKLPQKINSLGRSFSRALRAWSSRLQGLRRRISRSALRYRLVENQMLADSRFIERLQAAPQVCVIICVYNESDLVEDCVQSVLGSLSGSERVVIIDDCSTESKLLLFLREVAKHSAVTVLRNQTNLGYTKSVNIGIREAGDRDVILLNSDTVVPSGWISSLRRVAYSHSNVASATALSNNSGVFSLHLDKESEAHLPQVVEQTALSVRQSPRTSWPFFPTCNGFCVYIKAVAIQSVGLFDEREFPTGYGEENDWTERARKLGWSHRIDDSLFVWHKGSATFSDRREKLTAHAMERMQVLHPNYLNEVGFALKSRSFTRAIDFASKSLNQVAEPSRYRILFVLHSGTGGSRKTVDDLIGILQDEFDVFLFTSNGRTLELLQNSATGLEPLWTKHLKEKLTFPYGNNPGYQRFLQNTVLRLGIDIVNVHHTIEHDGEALASLGAMGIPVILNIHDYYFVCPTVNLLDENDRFCQGSCTRTKGNCNSNISHWVGSSAPPLKHNFVYNWREGVSQQFSWVKKFVFPNSEPMRLYSRHYPEFADRFVLIEHGVGVLELNVSNTPKSKDSHNLRVLVHGRISREKGFAALVQLGNYLKRNPKTGIELHFLGQGDVLTLSQIGTFHGSYSPRDFSKAVEKIDPDLALFLSPWGETFSYALSEALMLGLPIVSLNVGALGNRLAGVDQAVLINGSGPLEVIEAIKLAAKRQSNEEGKSKRGLAEHKSVEGMAQNYKDLFLREILGQVLG